MFMGPESVCGISMGVTKTAIRDWTIRDHRRHWDSLSEPKHGKALIQGPSANKTRELLKLAETGNDGW
jgi:hypothetical protein